MKTLAILAALALSLLAFADNVTMSHEAGTPYVDKGATATDNVDGDITSKIVATGTVNPAALGTYSRTYNVSDAAGNAAIPAVRTVIVRDTIPPVVALRGTATMRITVGTPYVEPGATVTDSFATGLTATITGSVNTAVVGNYVLTYRASDPSGNTAIPVTRAVTVAPASDTTPPAITIIP